MPAVTVIVPTRNRAALLDEALDSVAAQTFDDWECLVVDDGSTDGTADRVIRRSAGDPRFRYVPRATGRAGASACRNLGLRESRADLIVFLDSDDLLAPDCLSRRVAVMRRNADADFVVFDGDVFHDRVGDQGRCFDTGDARRDMTRFLALDPPWDTTAPIWRKTTLAAIGGHDEDLLSWQDIDLHIRALARSPRYFRERVVDHHIRWKGSDDRISQRKASESILFENCEPCIGKWRTALRAGNSPPAGWDEALAGVAFHLAEQWAMQRRTGRAWRVWTTTKELGVPRRHLMIGRAFLAALGTPAAGSTTFRGLLRRWKISVRLMPPTKKRVRR